METSEGRQGNCQSKGSSPGSHPTLRPATGNLGLWFCTSLPQAFPVPHIKAVFMAHRRGGHLQEHLVHEKGRGRCAITLIRKVERPRNWSIPWAQLLKHFDDNEWHSREERMKADRRKREGRGGYGDTFTGPPQNQALHTVPGTLQLPEGTKRRVYQYYPDFTDDQTGVQSS